MKTLNPDLRAEFLARMQQEKLPAELEISLESVYLPLAGWVQQQKTPGKTLVLGVNGSQGSGKSTLCGFLKLLLSQAYGYNVAGFSLDDLYKTRAERLDMAQHIHPLFATRGVPGTHDISLGLATLHALKTDRGTVAIPTFNKAEDDRRPPDQWPKTPAPADIVLFEGWCVGTPPQTEDALREPANDLERDEDPQGIWRHYVNRQLQTGYAELFARLDRLIFLQIPDLDCVHRWRGLQEQKLAAAAQGSQIMDATALRRFIMHYERLTRHALDTLPGQADLTLTLDPDHRILPLANPT